MQRDVLIVGSGISGLSCAHALASAGLSVEIVARAVPPATTSNVAAAFWYPYLAFPRPRVLLWAARSWHRFAALAEIPQTGVRMAEAVDLAREPLMERPWWCDAAAEVSAAPSSWVPPGYAGGWRFTAPVVDTRAYLPWLVSQVAALGVPTTRQAITDLREVAGRGRLVVDCAGLGARELAPDPQVHPIRGQLVVVKNPGLSRVLLDEHDPAGVTYVVPRGDDCVLGGTTDANLDDPRASLDDRQTVLARCVALEPKLATATVLADVVGLRPGRPCVKLGLQTSHAGVSVVHNYGHGGAGVTLSWGCAEEVADLVAERLALPLPEASRP